MSDKTIEETVDTGTADGALSEEPAVETDEVETEGSGELEEEKTGEKTEKAEKLPNDAPDWAVKRIGRLTAKRHEAETRAETAERERDAAKAEAETARTKYGDRDILAAAKLTGILPELLGKDEADTLKRADQLQANIDQLEATLDDYPEGYEGQDGKTVTPQQLRAWLRSARADLREIGDDAATLRKRKADEVRELLALGKAAKAKGWTPDAKPAAGAAAAKPHVKVRPAAGERVPEAAAPRRAATGAAKGPDDFSKVKTTDDLLAVMAKKYGG
jgi:hypothetical protein